MKRDARIPRKYSFPQFRATYWSRTPTGCVKPETTRGEEFGWPRLLKTVEDCAEQRARDIVECVMQSAEAFSGGAQPKDDATIFVGRIQEPLAEPILWETESVAVAVAA